MHSSISRPVKVHRCHHHSKPFHFLNTFHVPVSADSWHHPLTCPFSPYWTCLIFRPNTMKSTQVCHLARTRFSYHLIILHASHPSFHDNATNLTISTHPSNLVQGLVTCRQCFFKNTRELVDFSPKNLKTIIINKFVSFHLSLELTQIQPRPSHPSQVRDSHQNMDPIANLKTPLLELPHSPHINDKSAHPLNP